MPFPKPFTDFKSNGGGIVIVGAGLAGLFTALKLAPLPVTVISPTPLGEGASSAWAQGGIAAAVGEGDTPDAHVRDTIAAGAGIVDEEIARLVANEAGDRVRDLLRYGVPFDRDLEGHFVLSREAAHSAKRIVRVKGDGAGRAIMEALIATARETPSIKVLEGYQACALPTHGGGGPVTGLMLKRTGGNDTGALYRLPAGATIIATGGVGYLYRVTTNPSHARGDAIAMAARAGAVIADAEFVQFHPTAIDAGLDPAPLATEALRGEGAVLINKAGNRFLIDQHADAELGPRDIVARGVFREIQSGRGAFLDCRDAVGAPFPDLYPTVYKRCVAAGIDPVTQPIPVAPAEHYHMGGIATDEHGRASIEGLWACGEVTSTGLHGANRLASNSLLEAVVFAARVAADVATADAGRVKDANGPEPVHDIVTTPAPDRDAKIVTLRDTMQVNAGVERDAAGLAKACEVLAEMEREAGGDTGLANMALAGRFIVTAALARTESRGGHYRSDYPDTDLAQANRSFARLGANGAIDVRLRSSDAATANANDEGLIHEA